VYIYICITQCVVIYSQNSVWVESQGGTKRQVVVCFLCTTRAHGGFSICSVGGPRSLIFPGSTTEELKNAEIWMWIQNSLNKVEGLGNLNENLLTHTHAYVYVVICTYKRVYRDMYIYILYYQYAYARMYYQKSLNRTVTLANSNKADTMGPPCQLQTQMFTSTGIFWLDVGFRTDRDRWFVFRYILEVIPHRLTSSTVP